MRVTVVNLTELLDTALEENPKLEKYVKTFVLIRLISFKDLRVSPNGRKCFRRTL